MNKTIIININGTVLHIEEDAYEILKNYMTDVKRHFINSADSHEITTDIENRIAEMLSEILIRDSKQVIVELDVNDVIEQMGSVADFEHAEDDEKSEKAAFQYNTIKRRLFRDPDDHLVAGVCSGIANYFDIDVVWIRVIFAFFAFAGGSGLLIYAILWLVVPKAVTRADRMAMKGQKQNLQGFKQNLEEELSSVKQHISNFGDEAKPFVYKARDFTADFFHHLGAFLNSLVKIFIKLIGVLILLTCFGFIITAIVLFVGVVGFGNTHMFPMTPFSLFHNRFATPFFVSAFLVAVIPLLSIIIFTLKGIFKTGSINYITGSTALVVWIAALSSLIYYGIRISGNYKESAGFTQTISLKPTKNNVYYLKLNDLKYFSAADSARFNIKNLFHNENINVTDEDDNQSMHNVTINIEKSDVSKPVLVESYRARGRDYENALFNVRNTRYGFSQKDTSLTFDYKLMNTHDDEWHGEEIDLILKVPLNSRVVIEHDLTRILNADVWGCNNVNKRDNDKVKFATFTMTDNGLQCKVDTLVTPKNDTSKMVAKPDSTQ